LKNIENIDVFQALKTLCKRQDEQRCCARKYAVAEAKVVAAADVMVLRKSGEGFDHLQIEESLQKLVFDCKVGIRLSAT
jgi:hypothetical protein